MSQWPVWGQVLFVVALSAAQLGLSLLAIIYLPGGDDDGMYP